jgi:hypothetical protein
VSAAADAYIDELRAETRVLREQVNLGFTLAYLFQRVAEQRGCGFGVSEIGPGMPVAVIRDAIGQLEAELGSTPSNGRVGV